MKIRSWGGLGIVLLLTGCASGGGGGATASDPGVISILTGGGDSFEIHRGVEVRLNQNVTATRDEAWAALPAVYRELEIETDILDTPARRLGVSQHRFGSRILNRSAGDFFDCGMDPGLNTPLAGRMPITAQIVTDVLVAGSASELRTTVQGTAQRSGGNAGMASCRSTGLLEILIGEMVQKRVAPRR